MSHFSRTGALRLPRPDSPFAAGFWAGAAASALWACAGLLGLGLALGQSAQAATYTWDGTSADWFSNPSHWLVGNTPAGYPGAGDDAENLTQAAMTLGNSATVQSFLGDGAFSLNGGTFMGSLANATSTLQVNNVFTLNGGQINNFTLNQGTGGSVLVNSGNFANSIINANLDLSTNSAAFLQINGVVTANSTLTLGTSSGIQIYDGNGPSTLALGTKGRLLGFGTVSQAYGGGTFTNNGLVNANSKGNTLSLAVDNFNNAGTAEATASGSILSLNGTISNTDTFAASGGGTVAIHGSVTSGTASKYNAAGGTILVDGGNLTGTVGSTTGTGLTFSNNGGNYLKNATINGTLTLSALDAFLQINGTVTANGTINMGTTSNGIQIYDGNGASTLVLGSTGKLLGFGSVFQAYGGGTFTNNGLVNANSNGNTLILQPDFTVNNSGATMEATSGGILSLNKATTNSGTIKAGSGSVVNISGNFVSKAGSSIDAPSGTVNLQNVTVTGTVTGTTGTTLNFGNSGNNNITGATINSDIALTKDAFLQIDGTVTEGTVTDNSAIKLSTTSNGIQIYDGNGASTLALGTKGSLVGFGTVSQAYGGGTFTNNGLVNANAANQTLTISPTNFNNVGTAEATASGSVLSLNNNTTNSGIIKAGSGSVVNISGNFVSKAGSSIDAPSGTVNLQNVTVTGTVTGTTGTTLNFGNNGNNNITGATLNSDITLTNDAFVAINGTVAEGAVTDNNTINLSTTTGSIQLYNGSGASTFVLGGTGKLLGFGTLTQAYGGGTFTNNGLVNANAANQTLTISPSNFNNVGTAEATASGSVLSLNNNTTNSGIIKAGSGSVVSITGNFVSKTGSSIDAAAGTVNLQNVTVTGTVTGTTGTTLNFGNSGNNNITGATINSDIALTKDAFVRIDGTVTQNGTINLGTTSNGIQIYDGSGPSTFVLGSAGKLVGFGTVSEAYGGGTFTNNGLVNSNGSGAAQTLSINTDNFNNTGTTEVQKGAFLFVGNGGENQTAGLTQVDGTYTTNAPLAINGGTLKGSGTIVGNVVNNGGTVAPGDSPGTLTVNGNYSQGSGGKLNIEFDSAANDLLAVSGLATTGGTLDVNYTGSSPFTGLGSTFAFLDYGTVASSITGSPFTQYFTNETALSNNTGLITGQNGFTYELFNDTAKSALELKVLTGGAPVPEANSATSLGLMLALGLGGFCLRARAKKNKA